MKLLLKMMKNVLWINSEDGLVTHLLVVIFFLFCSNFISYSSIISSLLFLSKPQKDMLLEYLGIDPNLPYLGPPGLPAAYQKFKAIISALDEVLQLGSDPEWEAQFTNKRPWTIRVPEFIDIFVAKSQYYKTWKKKFLQAAQFSVMVDWLEQKEDRLSNEEIWGPGSKPTIMFKDLENWLQKKEREAVQKGKAKANTPFDVFSDVIQSNFGSDVSLATVLSVYSGENNTPFTGWISALVDALTAKVGRKRISTLFSSDNIVDMSKKEKNSLLATKLEDIAITLNLTPYNNKGEYKGKLLSVSHKRIQAAHVICPPSFSWALHQSTKQCDIPLVTLIKGHTTYQDVPVLTGKCKKYHEHFEDTSGPLVQPKCVYLNSAKFLKIGQSLWVDCLFSTSAVNAMYNFHASASAFAEYWNNTFVTKSTSVAFVQESLCTVAEESNINVEMDDALAIKDVTIEAFSILGENGVIRAADKHACPECTQEHKEHSEVVFNNPAAVVGVDLDDDVVPPLAAGASQDDEELLLPDEEAPARGQKHFVTMSILDGVVMGSQHCAYDHCTNDLSNARGGSLCDIHHVLLGTRCLACLAHQPQWEKYKKYSSSQGQSGVCRIPGQFYCVETLCAPCGVVIAWTKFARSESTTNILNFLGSVYQTEESRPDYICIDKGCQVLQTAVTNGSWDIWKRTSRFLVDSYHYINHHGSAPNLVIIAFDKNGNPYAKCAFNTQVCEQLNAWLGGFQSIMNCMTPGNFNWFMHVMLFYHTNKGQKKKKKKKKKRI
ncbi:hypothetical protein CPB84DRAFT_1817459 [Gymnopilus junonius]|uniref:Transposase n=1 Tax=Gymnopilus junonius TaxID=109634 RepID=A0A9P5NAS7_GYMJU|nr:hypothetical protein CPB84DRAFT_1817459 [Gymnopilus junonius]